MGHFILAEEVALAFRQAHTANNLPINERNLFPIADPDDSGGFSEGKIVVLADSELQVCMYNMFL